MDDVGSIAASVIALACKNLRNDPVAVRRSVKRRKSIVQNANPVRFLNLDASADAAPLRARPVHGRVFTHMSFVDRFRRQLVT